jgi:hypothetical protein
MIHNKIKTYNKAMLTFFLALLGMSIFFASCNKEDEKTAVELFSYGPMPIARGAELRFIGQNLDKVTAIVLPDNIQISSTQFTSHTSGKITLTVPQDAVEGFVVLKTPSGDITTKTKMGFSEPLSVTSFSPTAIKPGAQLTITGDYLNLVGEIIFTDRIVVNKSNFVSQSRQEIKLIVPEEAQTGKIAVSNGAEDPIIVYTESALNVSLPVISGINPNPVKAGTVLSISGSNLDLVKTIKFGGNRTVTVFSEHTENSIKLNVPLNAQDGKIGLIPASQVLVESANELVMVIPSISNISPASVKNGGTVTVTGTNLDLINQVTFSGNAVGTIQSGGSQTSVEIEVPNAALTGNLTFGTQAGKSVIAGPVTILAPSITSFTPTSGKANTSVTITGTNLDVVEKVKFAGGFFGSITAQNATGITLNVPVGALTGKITLVAVNGVEVESSTNYTVEQNLPNFSNFTESMAKRGSILTLNGTNMDLIKSIIFPGEVVATEYGLKTATMVQVYVPWKATVGYGKLKIVTYENEVGYIPTGTIFIGGVDPIGPGAKIINDFDEDGHSLDWDNWNGISQLMNDGNGVSGKYLKGNASLGAWDWKWIWGCNHDQLPKHSVVAANYVLKFDLKITSPISADANRFSIRLGGTDSQWVKFGTVNPSGDYETNGWITVTFDLVSQLGFSGTIQTGGEWGMIVQPAAALNFSAVNIDNIRFEPK